MENQWSLDTHGDPLGKVHDLIKYVWQASNLEGMLVTLNDAADTHATPFFITDVSVPGP